MPPLINKEEMDTMDSGNESDDDTMSTDIFEDIFDISQSHPNVNKEKHVKKYVILLNIENLNGKDC